MACAPIVVGLDGSAAAAAALRWAVWESRRTSAPLVAVHAYASPADVVGVPGLRSVQESLARAQATCWLLDALGGPGARACRPRLEVVEGSPPAVLAARSSGARMLVLGAAPASTGDLGRSLAARHDGPVACPLVLVPADGTPQPLPVPGTVTA